MVCSTFYTVPKHISRSNLKFQTQLPTADPTIAGVKLLSQPYSRSVVDVYSRSSDLLPEITHSWYHCPYTRRTPRNHNPPCTDNRSQFGASNDDQSTLPSFPL
eukprot:sb/3478232/